MIAESGIALSWAAGVDERPIPSGGTAIRSARLILAEITRLDQQKTSGWVIKKMCEKG